MIFKPSLKRGNKETREEKVGSFIHELSLRVYIALRAATFQRTQGTTRATVPKSSMINLRMWTGSLVGGLQ